MKRRQILHTAGASGAALVLMNQPLSTNAAQLSQLTSLKPSPRMPVLFLGHGSPMNAIEDNLYRRSWQALGAEFGKNYPQPQLILCISAHWLTRGWWLTGMDKPKTIHDFGGFPQALFDQQFPAPGAPAAAAEISSALRQPSVGLDMKEWGFDHGTWSVLKPMFPKADIPVIQLSMDYSRAPEEHYALARQLKVLRDRGVLIVGSGNIVHNLRAMNTRLADSGFGWATRFDDAAADLLTRAPDQIVRLREHPDFAAAAPTPDHFIPMLYLAGLCSAADTPANVLVDGYTYGSLSMTSYTLT